jgi:hypothetical protein
MGTSRGGPDTKPVPSETEALWAEVTAELAKDPDLTPAQRGAEFARRTMHLGWLRSARHELCDRRR